MNIENILQEIQHIKKYLETEKNNISGTELTFLNMEYTILEKLEYIFKKHDYFNKSKDDKVCFYSSDDGNYDDMINQCFK